MCFNKQVTVFIFLIIFVLTGCDWSPGKNLSFGEKNPPNGEAKVGVEFSCLNDIDRHIVKYFKGKLAAQSISAKTECLITALKKFEILTNDFARFPDGSYSPEGLADFLNRYYLTQDSQLGMGLINELMVLKAVVVGGKRDRITLVEFREFFNALRFIEKQALNNLNHIKIYRMANANEGVGASRNEVENAKAQIRATGLAFVEWIVKNNNSYSLAHIENLLTELKIYLKWDNYFNNTWSSKQLISLIRSYKEITTGDAGDEIKSAQWRSIVDSGTRIYGIYLNYKILLEKKNFTYGAPLEAFVDVVSEFLDILTNIVKSAPHKKISFQATTHLFQSLDNLELLKFRSSPLRPESLDAVYQRIVSYGLVDRSKNKVGLSDGLGEFEINEFKNEFNLWANAQLYLSSTINKALGFIDLEKLVLKNVLKNLDLSQFLLDSISSDQDSNSDMNDIVTHIRPLFKDGDERVYIAHLDDLSHLGVIHNLYNLTRMNVIRTLIRLLIRSFAEEDSRAQNMLGINEAESNLFLETVKPFVVDIKFLDPRSKETGKRIYSEGNLFTFSGDGTNYESRDGSELLTQYELAELLSLMWSGSQIQSKLYNEIAEACRTQGVPDGPLDDAFKKPKIERSCFQKQFSARNYNEFSNLPNMVESLNQLSELDQNTFVVYLQGVAFNEKSSKTHIEYGEIAVLNTVLHYVEVIFSQYDLNKNDILDSHEIMLAYPRFHGYLKSMVDHKMKKTQSVSMNKAIFAFLVKYKKLPRWFDFFTLKELQSRFNNDIATIEYKNLPKISLDRLGFINVLKVLAEQSLQLQKK